MLRIIIVIRLRPFIKGQNTRLRAKINKMIKLQKAALAFEIFIEQKIILSIQPYIPRKPSFSKHQPTT